MSKCNIPAPQSSQLETPRPVHLGGGLRHRQHHQHHLPRLRVTAPALIPHQANPPIRLQHGLVSPPSGRARDRKLIALLRRFFRLALRHARPVRIIGEHQHQLAPRPVFQPSAGGLIVLRPDRRSRCVGSARTARARSLRSAASQLCRRRRSALSLPGAIRSRAAHEATDRCHHSASASSSQGPRINVATSIAPSSAHRMLNTCPPS
jgi:hypothetical protein